MTPTFPEVQWQSMSVQFLPAEMPSPAIAEATVALVFAFAGDQCVVGDIAGRGWCIPGGHLEAGETPEQAVHREAYEEAGIQLSDLRLLGSYLFTDPQSILSTAPVYVARVARQKAVPPGTESRGVRLMSLEELKSHYYTWDPLIEAVCAYAWSQKP